jgi:[FeFe] hydrogenase H-cluster maturation GTPase HydF
MLATALARFFARAADVPRIHISLIGFMNAGKSSVMNAITQQPTSIVDPSPGTTADTKIALMEIHQIGPCKLLDTAGVDEAGSLGVKKLSKSIAAIKESDVVLYIIDPSNFKIQAFQEVFNLAQRRGKTSAVIFNQFGTSPTEFSTKRAEVLAQIGQSFNGELPSISVSANDRQQTYEKVIPFITRLKSQSKPVPLIPEKFLFPNRPILLNLPFNPQFPTDQLPRPQTMIVEYALRRFTSVSCFCMNLKAARSTDFAAERSRYLETLNTTKPSLAIVDSQTVDLFHQWTPSAIPLTTFAVTLANLQTGGHLTEFALGVDKLRRLSPGERVLIWSHCTQNRELSILPDRLKKLYPAIQIDWTKGRTFEEKNLKKYGLALVCGGCKLSPQQMSARIQDITEAGVPVVNYGMALAWLSSPEVLERVLAPRK